MTTPEVVTSRDIPRELIHDILLKLPASDVARFCWVSKLWRDIVRDPSFRSLHVKASHVTGGAAETLLVSEKRKPGCSDEVGVFNVSSGKALCCVPIMSGYVLANVCNGFLCFAHGNPGTSLSSLDAPVLVCNPATGETLKLPDAPPPASWNKTPLFVLGFSPHTNEYKLFRLSSSSSSMRSVEVDVCTLGGSADIGWRKQTYHSDCRPMGVWAPVLIDGKLYVATLPWHIHYSQPLLIPDRVLVIDVSTERCHTYRLPSYWTRTFPENKLLRTNAFELSGQLCFAAHIIQSNRLSQSVRFWVMSPPPPEDYDGYHRYDMDKGLCCNLSYDFHMEGHYSSGLPCAGWLGDDGMLCYMQGSTLHKYDTRVQRSRYGNLRWDQQVELPTTLLSHGCQWPNIYGGYRPTLLSPLTLQPQENINDENKYQLEHAMLSMLCENSSKRGDPRGDPSSRAAIRRRRLTPAPRPSSPPRDSFGSRFWVLGSYDEEDVVAEASLRSVATQVAHLVLDEAEQGRI